jgi:hypothetical protein
MPRSSWIQNSFNGGEWSPLTYGRSDIARYKNALSTCLNYVPTAQGGLTRRPGTKFVAYTKSSQSVRLIPFEFSITQAYVIEFGAGYVRFYTNEGQLLSGGTPYEVATPYGAADLWDLSFTQSADVLYIAHPNYKPRKLQRAGALSWSLNTISFLDGPYLLLNTSATTLTSSATTGSATVTASSTTGINGGAGFTSNDIGRTLRLKVGSSWAWGSITAVASTTSVTVSWQTTVGGTTASSVWRLGVWYGVEGSSATANYPRCVVFNQDRLIWAGSAQYPSRLDGSNTSDYENYAPSGADGVVVDSNAISFSLNSTKVNVVNWMVTDEWGLLAGTASGEWVVAASTQQNAVTPTNVTAKMTTSYGGTNVPPVRMGKSTLFVQRTKRKLREMTYQFTLGTFQAPDISLVSEHLTKSGIKQMAGQPAPYPNVWIVRNDGQLVGVSYDKDQEVLAWHRHTLGGYSDAGQTASPIIESVAVIPSPGTDRDAVWLSVQRSINGSTVRTVELMQKFWEDGDVQADAYFVDCGATYSGAATTTVSGLTWLAGQTVSVLADGSVHPTCVVSGAGAITLQRSASKVQIGLGYSSTGKTMRIEAGAADGTSQGKIKRIHRAIFRFFQSVGLSVQSTSGAAFPEPWRSSADLMDNPVALYTGDKRWAWDGSYELEGQVSWTQSDPLPSNVLMVVAQLDTQDGG